MGQFWMQFNRLSSDTISFMVQQGLIPVARDFEYRSQFNILFLGANAFSRNDVRRKLQLYHSSIARQ